MLALLVESCPFPENPTELFQLRGCQAFEESLMFDSFPSFTRHGVH